MTIQSDDHPDQPAVPAAFNPRELLRGKVYKFAFNTEDWPGIPGMKLFVMTSDSGEIEELALHGPGAPALFLSVDGSVREVSYDGEVRVVEPAKAAKAIDCEAAVRWSIRYGMNSAFTGCVRAVCKQINCRYHGSCGGWSQLDHDNNVRYACGTWLAPD